MELSYKKSFFEKISCENLPTRAPKGTKLLIHENSSTDGIVESGDSARFFIFDSAADVHPN
jgi:hypothetical protein